MKNSALEKYSLALAPLVWLAGLFILVLPQVASGNDKWEPIPAEDLAATECKAYPGSSAEFLFDRHVLDASRSSRTQQFYRRIKIYSAKGATEAGVLNIEYPGADIVSGLAARVSKISGSVIEYGKKEFMESVAFQIGSLKFKKLAFAVPDLSPGDVLEFNWTQSVHSNSDDDHPTNYEWWYCQQSVPVREFTFTVAASQQDYNMYCFNVEKVQNIKEGKYGGKLVMKDLPPFEAEPYLPPERDIRGWFLILFSNPYMRWYDKEDDFWKLLSSYYEEEFRLEIKPSGGIKAKAAELTKGLGSDEEKLKALYDFTQTQVANFEYLKTAEILTVKKKRDNETRDHSPGQTLALKSGYPRDVNNLFASLAKAAGYDVRLAWSASRDATFNIMHKNGWIFLDDHIVVIQVGKEQRYYSPGKYYVPAGLLDQANEGAPYLLLDAQKVIYGTNPIALANQSIANRKGRFTLDAEGNLEGEVEITMTGHIGSKHKQDWAKKQEEEISTEYRETITKPMPAAEVSEMKWENLSGNQLPLIVRYKIKVPAYADVAGSKIILAPNVFEHGATTKFTSEKRQFAIYFPYAWSEHDDIELSLPEGYTLDAGSAPANVGDITGALGVRYQVGYKSKSRRIVYQRDFSQGADGAIAFQAVSYPALKKKYDAIHHSDEHTLVLKQVENAVSPVPATIPVPLAH